MTTFIVLCLCFLTVFVLLLAEDSICDIFKYYALLVALCLSTLALCINIVGGGYMLVGVIAGLLFLLSMFFIDMGRGSFADEAASDVDLTIA
jgi:hypothetical protein